MEIKTQVYRASKLRTKTKYLAVLAVLFVVGTASAAIVLIGPWSAATNQTPAAIFAAAKTTGAEPAHGMIEPTLFFGQKDHVLIEAWQQGYSALQTIKLVVRLSGAGYATCASLAAVLAADDGTVGKISIDMAPGTSYALLDIATGSFAAGKCTLDSTSTAKTFDVTTAMTSAAKGSAFDLVWQYPTGASPVTFEFAASS